MRQKPCRSIDHRVSLSPNTRARTHAHTHTSIHTPNSLSHSTQKMSRDACVASRRYMHHATHMEASNRSYKIEACVKLHIENLSQRRRRGLPLQIHFEYSAEFEKIKSNCHISRVYAHAHMNAHAPICRDTRILCFFTAAILHTSAGMYDTRKQNRRK